MEVATMLIFFQLQNFVVDWMEPIKNTKQYEKRLNDAVSYIPIIIKYSKQYEIDPFLATYILARESSFKMHGIGKAKGEKGLMQVHGLAAKNQNLKTADGQIKAGIR